MRVLILLTVMLAAGFASPAAAQFGYDPDNPPGANDYECKPSAAHPEPVVLVHGLGANAQANWYYVSPALAEEGYCVFALTYGRKADNPPPFDQPGGLIRVEESAEQLAGFVDRVLEATGARQVDIVGHSEGSLMPNYYVKFLPQARAVDAEGVEYLKVDDYVGLTPLWDGTDVGFLGTLRTAGGGNAAPLEALAASGCASCPQFLTGSDFIAKMNEGGTPRVDGVTYTMIMTRYDQLVVPYTSGEMEGATNIVVQDQCAADPSEHLAVAFNPLVLQDIRNALDPANARPVSCTSYGPVKRYHVGTKAQRRAHFPCGSVSAHRRRSRELPRVRTGSAGRRGVRGGGRGGRREGRSGRVCAARP